MVQKTSTVSNMSAPSARSLTKFMLTVGWKLFCFQLSVIEHTVLWTMENILGLKPSENALLTTVEIVQKYGYPIESHDVTTDDGYILTLHRIPHGKNGDRGGTARRGPIFIHHGIETSSGWWFLLPPQFALPFLLADAGYDVFIGNCRGNSYSRRHKHLKPSQKEFWNYSFHEIGYFDLPKAVDHILRVTGVERLKAYIGHSMGTTVGFVWLSTRPEYNDKIEHMIALSPVAYMKENYALLTWPIRFLPDTIVLKISDFLFAGGPLPILRFLGDFLCRICDHRIGRQIAQFGFKVASMRDDSRNATATAMSTALGHMRAGTATRVYVQFFQSIRSGRFARYDFGRKRNLKMYGSPLPPSYELDRITCPVHAFYSVGDGVCSPMDVKRTLTELGNCVNKEEACVKFKNFQHVDFVYSELAKELVYDPILEILSSSS